MVTFTAISNTAQKMKTTVQKLLNTNISFRCHSKLTHTKVYIIYYIECATYLFILIGFNHVTFCLKFRFPDGGQAK